MAKTAYEIRADILALSKEYVEKQIELNTRYAQKMGKTTGTDLDALQMWTPENIMKTAMQFYSDFVEHGTPKK